MNGQTIGLFGMALVVLAAFGLSAVAQQDRPAHRGDHAEHNEALLACAKACSDCQRECDLCSSHCARMLNDGKKEHYTTLQTCRDCADVCATAAQITSRGGPFAKQICDACADVCARCGEACAKIADDPHMKRCAEECRKCEKACREMNKHVSTR